jgi:hypothetical protein
MCPGDEATGGQDQAGRKVRRRQAQIESTDGLLQGCALQRRPFGIDAERG